MTSDAALRWADNRSECIDNLTVEITAPTMGDRGAFKVLAAEVRRLMECCAIAGRDHADYIFDTEARLATARAEAARLRADVERLRKALLVIKDADEWHLGASSCEAMDAALEER